ncbi:MAG: Hsp20/alpha crystallin family protein [Brachymonas sp.]|nr:Hsp20/alpha crystallin family protein [Brachymonas sp.]
MTSLMTRGTLFDELFKDVAPGFFIKPLHGDPLPAASQIRIDVNENDKEFIVQAEIPGVPKEDIHVSIDGNTVTLQAEVKQHDKQTEGERVLRSERYFGSVSRSFQLPVDIDEAAAKAKCENGVLQLTLPKKISRTPQKLVVE